MRKYLPWIFSYILLGAILGVFLHKLWYRLKGLPRPRVVTIRDTIVVTSIKVRTDTVYGGGAGTADTIIPSLTFSSQYEDSLLKITYKYPQDSFYYKLKPITLQGTVVVGKKGHEVVFHTTPRIPLYSAVRVEYKRRWFRPLFLLMYPAGAGVGAMIKDKVIGFVALRPRVINNIPVTQVDVGLIFLLY